MNLSVGIVGLPNVGKSTLFNALLKKQQAYVANFPFATIEPNIGVVPVPDYRLIKLAEVVQKEENLSYLPPIAPSTVEFVDIAGLIAGASKGEGLGNKFLAHIRETSAICHVIRVFSDPSVVKEGSVSPQDDFLVVETELALSDLQTLEKQKDPGNTPDKEAKRNWEIICRFKEALAKGIPVRSLDLKDDEVRLSKMLGLLTAKPVIIVLNVDEEDLKRADEVSSYFSERLNLKEDQVICVSAKVESELAGLSEQEQKEYLASLGISQLGLERLIRKAFSTLGLISFLTAGVKEVRAWTIKSGTNAQEAASVIHSDFCQKFIKADVVDFKTFVSFGGWKAARDAGKVRSEGKDYIVSDGDVIEFLVGR